MYIPTPMKKNCMRACVMRINMQRDVDPFHVIHYHKEHSTIRSIVVILGLYQTWGQVH